ncbi:hypothetical protein L3X38_017410 [Prunus dulcis]|uniref:GAG-pre-integrase domain-containing protein n=1 Tax=Prunus dulcis TaxID=3755 RepID=A0AAD4ZA46_PRUDU|nr:hypothetical protein L3X38_017410 [Prunus dulcis]
MGVNFFVGTVAAASGNLCGSAYIPELSSNTRDPYITSANGLPSPITGKGTISLTPTLSLSRALLVPNIHCNLLSVGRLLDTLNASATFYPTHCSFQDLKTCETIGHGKRIGGLYYLTLPSAPVRDRVIHTVQSCNVKDKQQLWLWHRRLGHPSFGYLKRLFSSLFRSCAESVLSVYLMKNKHDVASILPEFCAMMSTQFHDRVKVFRTDKGGHGVLAATYLINCTPSRVLNFKTPLDILCTHTSPVSVSKLPPKVFGCVAYIHVYSHQRSKLDPCALRCVFIGYSTTQKGYKCYHPHTQKVDITLDVTFHVEDDTNYDLGEKTIGLLVDSDRSHRSGAEEEALCLEITCHPDVHDWSHDLMPDNNTLCLETIGHLKDSDRSLDTDPDTLWLERPVAQMGAIGRLGELMLFHVFPAKTSLIQYPLPCHCPSLIVILSQVN